MPGPFNPYYVVAGLALNTWMWLAIVLVCSILWLINRWQKMNARLYKIEMAGKGEKLKPKKLSYESDELAEIYDKK